MAKKKAVRKKKKAAKKKVAHARKPKQQKRRLRGPGALEILPAPARRGLGPGAGGQAGDIQGLSRSEDVDSESVEELAEEGQEFEAEVVSGVEDALDPDQDEVHTHEDFGRVEEPEE